MSAFVIVELTVKDGAAKDTGYPKDWLIDQPTVSLSQLPAAIATFPTAISANSLSVTVSR